MMEILGLPSVISRIGSLTHYANYEHIERVTVRVNIYLIILIMLQKPVLSHTHNSVET